MSEILSKAKPMLFNTEMVQAILDGRKTVTRRCVKPKSKNAYGFFVLTNKSDGSFAGVYDYDEDENAFDKPQKQPAYKGDILYVRETWGRYSVCEGVVPDIYYKADAKAPQKIKWIPSIHMPKEAARLFLRVTDVRVEQLHDINFYGILSEGIEIMPEAYNDPDNAYLQAVETFKRVWDRTVKESDLDRYGWVVDPWVWVIEFERVEVQK